MVTFLRFKFGLLKNAIDEADVENAILSGCPDEESIHEIILTLIEAGARPNASVNCKTALVHAMDSPGSVNGFPHKIKMLLDNGADPNLVDCLGRNFSTCGWRNRGWSNLYSRMFWN
jgi:hypothetical protein